MLIVKFQQVCSFYTKCTFHYFIFMYFIYENNKLLWKLNIYINDGIYIIFFNRRKNLFWKSCRLVHIRVRWRSTFDWEIPIWFLDQKSYFWGSRRNWLCARSAKESKINNQFISPHIILVIQINNTQDSHAYCSPRIISSRFFISFSLCPVFLFLHCP